MSTVKDDEKIVRILHRDWVVDGEVQINAFALRQNETYISVNRPIIDSFSNDILDFVTKHHEYLVSDDSACFRQAVLISGEVRNIKIELGMQAAEVSIDIEPRDKNYQSHAGILTCYGEKNLKGGQLTEIQLNNNCRVSVPAILQKVQFELLQLSSLQTSQMNGLSLEETASLE